MPARTFSSVSVALLFVAVASPCTADLYWAYGYDKPVPSPAPAQAGPSEMLEPASPRTPEGPEARRFSLPGSAKTYTEREVKDRQELADWFPEEHPPLPEVLRHGPRSLGNRTWACGYCHMPNGLGRPENSPVAGLPREYILQQLLDFQAGHRESTDPRKRNTALMAGLAGAMTRAEMEEAAAYFSALPMKPWITVIETDTVPELVPKGGMFIPTESGRRVLLGEAILESPLDPEGTERLRDPHSGFRAYAPLGSIAAGRALATTGARQGESTPATLACAACHGDGLRGSGNFPALAGRSPSYLARQLNDFRTGHRRGAQAAAMAPVVEKLTDGDILRLAAYLASLPP